MPPPPMQAQPGGAAAAGATPPGSSPLPPGSPVTIDAVMRLLRDNASRKFRVDIETDSTIAGDQAQERQDRMSLIEALTKLIETWGPIVTAQPIMAPLAAELMQFAVRAFRVGRQLEQVIEETAEKFMEAAGQPKPPPQPNPDELIKLKGIEAKVAAEIQKAQIGVQQAQVDAQATMASHHVDMAGLQAKTQADQQKAALDANQSQMDARNEQASTLMKAEIEQMRFRHAVAQANKPEPEPK